MKKPSRPHFSISWLRPLIPLETADYRALCTQVSKPDGDRAQQRIWFGGSKTIESTIQTVAYKTERVRKRYAVRNALRWLEVRANPTMILWDAFRCLHIGEPLVDANTIKFFVNQVGTELLKRWATPFARSVPKMAHVEYLIPACILAHHAAKVRGEARYVAGKWVSEGAPTWRWEVDVNKVDDTGVPLLGLQRLVDTYWTTCTLVVRLSMFWIIWPVICVGNRKLCKGRDADEILDARCTTVQCCVLVTSITYV